MVFTMVDYIREAPVELRCNLIGSIFTEKIEFDGKKYRTSKLNEVAALIFQDNSELQKEEQGVENPTSRSVPRAGVEPARPSLGKRF